MSPKFFINGNLVAELTETEDHSEGVTVNGHAICVNMHAIDARFPVQELFVKSDLFAGKPGLGRSTENGRRKIELSTQGSGAEVLPGGKILTVQLDNAPIRGSVRGPDGRPTPWSNPRWRR